MAAGLPFFLVRRSSQLAVGPFGRQLHLAKYAAVDSGQASARLLSVAAWLDQPARTVGVGAQRLGAASAGGVARRFDGSGSGAAGPEAQRSFCGAVGGSFDRAQPGAGLVQPGTAHVPACDHGDCLGGVCSVARLAGAAGAGPSGVVGALCQRVHLRTVQLPVQRVRAAGGRAGAGRAVGC